MEKQKNVWVVSTKKPSRLLKNTYFGGLVLTEDFFAEGIGGHYTRHIYITNSEKLKEGDYAINSNGYVIKINQLAEGELSFIPLETDVYCNKGTWHKVKDYKKIILTTDYSLAPDVQKIDDDFLEFLVKNPSCEWVEVSELKFFNPDTNESGHCKWELDIPQEELKQEWDINTCRYWDMEIGCEREKCICENQEPKQESLEKVKAPIGKFIIDNAVPTQGEDGNYYHYSEVCKLLKLQQKTMYSEEDMIAFAARCVGSFLSDRNNNVEQDLVTVIIDRNKKEFEQFKKKQYG